MLIHKHAQVFGDYYGPLPHLEPFEHNTRILQLRSDYPIHATNDNRNQGHLQDTLMIGNISGAISSKSHQILPLCTGKCPFFLVSPKSGWKDKNQWGNAPMPLPWVPPLLTLEYSHSYPNQVICAVCTPIWHSVMSCKESWCIHRFSACGSSVIFTIQFVSSKECIYTTIILQMSEAMLGALYNHPNTILI